MSLLDRLRRLISPSPVIVWERENPALVRLDAEEAHARIRATYGVEVIAAVRANLEKRPEPEARKKGVSETFGAHFTPPAVPDPTDEEWGGAISDSQRPR